MVRSYNSTPHSEAMLAGRKQIKFDPDSLCPIVAMSAHKRMTYCVFLMMLLNAGAVQAQQGQRFVNVGNGIIAADAANASLIALNSSSSLMTTSAAMPFPCLLKIGGNYSLDFHNKTTIKIENGKKLQKVKQQMAAYEKLLELKKRSKFSEALDYLRTWRSKIDEHFQNYFRVQKAIILCELGEYREGFSAFKNIGLQDPLIMNNHEVQKWLAYFYVSQQNYDQAMAVLNAAVLNFPDNFDFYEMRSRTHFAMGNYADSMADIVCAENLGFNSAQASAVVLDCQKAHLSQLLKTVVFKPEFEGGVAILQKTARAVCEVEPDNVQALTALVKIYEYNKDPGINYDQVVSRLYRVTPSEKFAVERYLQLLLVSENFNQLKIVLDAAITDRVLGKDLSLELLPKLSENYKYDMVASIYIYLFSRVQSMKNETKKMN